MNRQQAMTLLKKLVTNDLVNPDYVNIINSIDKHCQIQIKCDYNKSRIEEITKEHGLMIEEDNEGKYLVIYEP